jgi:DNA-directed RNA polymerase alpha subunit
VNFSVSNVRVGQMTDYDKLAIELWTDEVFRLRTHWHLPQNTKRTADDIH